MPPYPDRRQGYAGHKDGWIRVIARRARLIYLMASGMRDLGAPGLAYWLRTGLAVCSSMAAASKKSSAAGVAVT